MYVVRVLHLITTLDRGGAETQLIQQVEVQQTHGLDVTIYYLKGKGTLAKFTKEASARRLKGCFFLVQLYSLIFLIMRQKPDLVVAHLPRSELLAALVSKITRTKLIVTKHNTEKFWPKGNPVASRMLAKFVDRRACSTICISEAVRDFLCSAKELNSSTATVIRYGIKRRNRDSSQYWESTGQSAETKIICVARLEPQKNLSALIELIPRIDDINPVLEIFGEGSERDSLRFQIQSKNLGNRIKLRGVSDNVRSKMRESDIMILPSLYEGLGFVLLEALEEGCLIVASRVPAIEEVLGKDYPFLFNPKSVSEFEERVRDVLTVNRSWFSQYSLEVLERFSLEEQVSKTLNVYRACLEK
jgi:glycosyltransferase involved in cell wall biosynthesis